MQRIDGRLSPEQRAADLARMADERFDVVVVGGGVTGAGCALDAASRGLRTALLEQRDYASGTSSRSSKLIHGGLRYLRHLELGLVREALRERRLALEVLAPHLVRPIEFMYPLTHRLWERAYLEAGLTLYDRLGGGRARHRHLRRDAAREHAPALRGVIGGMTYLDAQVDDARHTVTLARTAAAHGAAMANGARVTAVRADGVTVEDVETGATIEIDANVTINATGVWSEQVQRMATDTPRIAVQASKGVHLLVPRDRIELHTNLVLPTPTSVLFVIAWGDDQWIVGTTDTGHAGEDLAEPTATTEDVDYLLGQLNRVLRVPLARSDVSTTYAGLRPLLSGGDSPSRLSREHAVVEHPPGLVTVAGGKYTTYRVMARHAVDAAVRSLARPVGPSRTHEIPLLGAGSVPTDAPRRLRERYGSATTELQEAIARDPSLGRPLVGECLRAEIVHSVTHEGARHLADALERRTRLAMEAPDGALPWAPEAARLMAPWLGWDDARIERELAEYEEAVSARRAAAAGG